MLRWFYHIVNHGRRWIDKSFLRHYIDTTTSSSQIQCFKLFSILTTMCVCPYYIYLLWKPWRTRLNEDIWICRMVVSRVFFLLEVFMTGTVTSSQPIVRARLFIMKFEIVQACFWPLSLPLLSMLEQFDSNFLLHQQVSLAYSSTRPD